MVVLFFASIGMLCGIFWDETLAHVDLLTGNVPALGGAASKDSNCPMAGLAPGSGASRDDLPEGHPKVPDVLLEDELD